PAHQQQCNGKQRAETESDAPADVGMEPSRIEQREAKARAERRANPEAAIDREIHAAAQARGNEFVYRGIDRRIFAADAESGEEPAHQESKEIVGKGRGKRRAQVNREGKQEQAFPAKAVREPAKKQGAEHGATNIGRTGPADLRGRKTERIRPLENAAYRADQRNFQPVQHPGDSKRDHHAPVPARPWQPIESSGDVGVNQLGPPTANRSTSHHSCAFGFTSENPESPFGGPRFDCQRVFRFPTQRCLDQFLRVCNITCAKPPATRPQKAEPIPTSVTPDAVTRKVISAASRSRSDASAAASPLPIVPINARPAMAATSSWGKAANSAATVAPNNPTST